MTTQGQWPQEPEALGQDQEQQGGMLSSAERARQGAEEALKQGRSQEQQGGILSSAERARQGTEEVLDQGAQNIPGSEQQEQ